MTGKSGPPPLMTQRVNASSFSQHHKQPPVDRDERSSNTRHAASVSRALPLQGQLDSSSILQDIRQTVGERLSVLVEKNKLPPQKVMWLKQDLAQEFFDTFVKPHMNRNRNITFNDDLFNQLADFMSKKLEHIATQ